MSTNIYIVIGILIILIITTLSIVGIILYVKGKKKGEMKQEPDYRVFYYLGFIWIPIGVVFMIAVNVVMGIAFMGLGTSYIAIGLANKDKWKNKQ